MSHFWMMRASRTTLGFAAVAACVLMGAPNLRAQQGGNAANGKQVFSAQMCDQCHGAQGEGGKIGPQIGPPSFSFQMFLQFVRNPKDPMPAFSASDVSDAQLGDVFAFLQSQTAAAAAPVSATPPSGNADNGRTLYTKVGCYECHDRDAMGGGGTGPRLAAPVLGWPAFDKQVRTPANAMPPYTVRVLSEQDLGDIYAFLQTIPKPPAGVPQVR